MWYRDPKLDADSYFGLKKWFWGRFRTMTQKPSFYVVFFGLTPLTNSVAMATPKIPGDQELFERVCYLLKLKVTKFQLSRPNGF